MLQSIKLLFPGKLHLNCTVETDALHLIEKYLFSVTGYKKSLNHTLTDFSSLPYFEFFFYF